MWQSDPRKILVTFQEYFHDIFRSSNPSLEDLNRVLDSISKKVTPEMNIFLTKRFTKEEMKLAIKGFQPTKAPGPNGFPAIFYQRYWDIIGKKKRLQTV